jgi:hypothetical protein
MEDFNSKYTGQQVEDLLDQVASGNAGGGGCITVETDPIFSASPAAAITEDDIAMWNGAADLIEDHNTDISQLFNDIEGKQDAISDEKIAEWDSKYAKPSGGIPKSDLTQEVQNALRYAEQDRGTVNKIKVNGKNIGANNGVVDLGNLGTYSTYIADFTMEALRDGIYNGTNIDCNTQALETAMNANKIILVRESESSDYKGVYVLNGYAEDLLYFSIVDSYGNIIWCDGTDYGDTAQINAQTLHFHYWQDKQDNLVSGENIKTINGESIVGSGNITIEGGAGEKGDKGDTGVGVQSVKQTTTSNVDSGYNVVTVTLTDGTTSTFSVKNGSKGSTGANGTNGKDGADGATFTPSVDAAGNLSWSNDKGLTNPPTVNIKGPKGDKGDAGEGGGSSSGSGAYSEVNHGTSDTTFTLTPNTFHIWEEVSALTLTLGGETSGIANEYLFQFNSGATATSLTLPDDIKWANDSAPTIGENMIYQVSILKGLASVLEFSNAPVLIENKVTMSISGTKYLVSLQYAAASDIVVKVRTPDGPISVNILSGETSKMANPMGPMVDSSAYIESITPADDNIYNYVW